MNASLINFCFLVLEAIMPRNVNEDVIEAWSKDCLFPNKDGAVSQEDFFDSFFLWFGSQISRQHFFSIIGRVCFQKNFPNFEKKSKKKNKKNVTFFKGVSLKEVGKCGIKSGESLESARAVSVNCKITKPRDWAIKKCPESCVGKCADSVDAFDRILDAPEKDIKNQSLVCENVETYSYPVHLEQENKVSERLCLFEAETEATEDSLSLDKTYSESNSSLPMMLSGDEMKADELSESSILEEDMQFQNKEVINERNYENNFHEDDGIDLCDAKDENDFIGDNTNSLENVFIKCHPYFGKPEGTVCRDNRFEKTIQKVVSFGFREKDKESGYFNFDVFAKHHKNIKQMTPSNMPCKFNTFLNYLSHILPKPVGNISAERLQLWNDSGDPSKNILTKTFLCGSFSPLVVGNVASSFLN